MIIYLFNCSLSYTVLRLSSSRKLHRWFFAPAFASEFAPPPGPKGGCYFHPLDLAEHGEARPWAAVAVFLTLRNHQQQFSKASATQSCLVAGAGFVPSN